MTGTNFRPILVLLIPMNLPLLELELNPLAVAD
jgi:hypothetical protein